MTILLAICAALITGLTLYAVAHYFCATVFVFGGPKRRNFTEHPEDEVSVLVPARNEGEWALRALASLEQQDHRGAVTSYLLVKDSKDSSVPFFARRHPEVEFDVPAPALIELPSTGNHKAVVVYTGLDPKSDKVNWMVARLTSPYLAILDCDHQARPDWIRTSVCLLKEKGARIIQAERGPLFAHGFFPLWDSLHQHVGCELFNAAFTALRLPLFFTGTTAVMETGLLKAHPLSKCLTEDAYFSYTLLQHGVRIIYNPYSGSDEETSPDLYSFLARRRRWANGHTEAFFKHLRILWDSPLSIRERLQFLFHGVHYLVALVVFALHLLIGLIFAVELSPLSLATVAVTSLILAWLVARTQCTVGFRGRAVELGALFTWFAPAMVIAMNLAQAIVTNDPRRTLLPGPELFQAVGLVGFCAPLIVLLAGLVGLRYLGVGTLLAVVSTYLGAFYLDLCGVLLGLADFVTGGAKWRVVNRAARPAAAAAGKGQPVALTVAVDLKESWRMALVAASALAIAKRGMPEMTRNRVLLAVMGCLFVVGALFAPHPRIQLAGSSCQILEQDDLPWIVPAKKANAHCQASPSKEYTRRVGSFELVRDDTLVSVDGAYWDKLDTTFPCNKAVFSPANVVPMDQGGVQMVIDKANNEKGFATGSIATKDTSLTYGRFETVMKPAKTSGGITAFFLYRFDPWQEIDAEFLGKDTTKLLLNVYYNPGEPGDLYNYGYRGTPVVVDVGFDASEDFHRYAIEWEAEEIRWFVDDRLIHVRHAGQPTPIPHLPMRFHVNVWPCCSEELAGKFDPAAMPTSAGLKSVTISRWEPSVGERIEAFVDTFFSPTQEPRDWRASAGWIHP